MRNYVHRYNYLSLLSFIILLILGIIQISWMQKATKLQKQEVNQKLKRLVSDMALDINAIDHDIFHSDTALIRSIPIEEIEQKIRRILDQNEVPSLVHFALYFDSTKQIMLTDAPDYTTTLMNSDIRACMSCIVSFSIAPNVEEIEGEEEEEYRKRLMENSSFEYFKPIAKLERGRPNLWLSLYRPKATSEAIQSLIYLFIVSVVFLIVLLYLLYTLLDSLSKHKKLAQVKNDFFNNMTHEFKTPLSSIRLASRVLRQSKDEEKNKTYFNLIERESLILEKQIDRLLDLSLLDNHGLALESTTIDLHELIKEVPKRLKVLVEEKSARIQLQLFTDQASLKGDYDHLLNCFCNLVENSLKYGSSKILIQLGPANQEGYQNRISVRDDGPGIPPKFAKHVFDRFFRVSEDNQYKAPGFGIGLSYVKGIIEAHKGKIFVNTQYTEGCEFIIDL